VNELRVPLLDACGVAHGFGRIGATPPDRLLRPDQVHGVAVAEPVGADRLRPEQADAVVSREPGLAVAVVTADCVPVLAASRSGRAVAAIHAGWRGLAGGVVQAGIECLRERSSGESLVAAIGPRIGVCCYEVDDPVLQALERRFGADLPRALVPTREGHARIDLAWLTAFELERCGLEPSEIALLDGVCTQCNPSEFESHRRDGALAGRLLHHIAATG
jgi:YfiH family protein